MAPNTKAPFIFLLQKIISFSLVFTYSYALIYERDEAISAEAFIPLMDGSDDGRAAIHEGEEICSQKDRIWWKR